MMSASVDLPDVNGWLALSASHHPYHRRARAYWEQEAAPEISFCRVTMLGLVRLLMQPRVMGDAALPTVQALGLWQRWLQLPEVSLRAEPAACEATLQALATPTLPPRRLTDAYLAAMALSGGMRLVSFDSDCRRFDGLDLLRLEPEEHAA